MHGDDSDVFTDTLSPSPPRFRVYLDNRRVN